MKEKALENGDYSINWKKLAWIGNLIEILRVTQKRLIILNQKIKMLILLKILMNDIVDKN